MEMLSGGREKKKLIMCVARSQHFVVSYLFSTAFLTSMMNRLEEDKKKGIDSITEEEGKVRSQTWHSYCYSRYVFGVLRSWSLELVAVTCVPRRDCGLTSVVIKY